MSFYSEKMKHFDTRYDGFLSRCTMKSSDSHCIHTTSTCTTPKQELSLNLVQQQEHHHHMHKIQHIPKGLKQHRLQQHSQDRKKTHCDVPLHNIVPSEDISSIDSSFQYFHDDDESTTQHSLSYNRLGYRSGASQQVDATIPRMRSHLNDNENSKNQPQKLYTQHPNSTDFAVKRSTYNKNETQNNTILSTSTSLQEHLKIPISIRRPLSSISEHSAAETSTYSHHIHPRPTLKAEKSATSTVATSSNTKPSSVVQEYYEDSNRFTNYGKQLYQSHSHEDVSFHQTYSRQKERSSTLSSSYFVPPKDRFQHGYSQRRANLTRPGNHNKKNVTSKETISYLDYVSTSLDEIQQKEFTGSKDVDDLEVLESSSSVFPLDTIHIPPKHKVHPWDNDFNEKQNGTRTCDDSFHVLEDEFWQCHPKHTQQNSVTASSIDTASIAPSIDEQLYHMETFHDILPKRSGIFPTNEYDNDNDTSSGDYILRKQIAYTNGIDYDSMDEHVQFVSQDPSIDSKSTYSRYEDGNTEVPLVDDDDYNDDNHNDNLSVSSQRSILDILFNDYSDCLVDTEDSWKDIWNTFVLREKDIAAIVNRIDTAMYELDATTVEYYKQKQKTKQKTTTTNDKRSRGRSRTRTETTDRTTTYEV